MRSIAEANGLQPFGAGHVNNFDGLRLVFATMVALFHISLLSRSPQLQWMLKISSTFAVQAFFFVSGFLVTMSCESTIKLRSYFAKRLRRIAPAYVFVVLSAALSLVTLSTLSYGEYFSSESFSDYVKLNLVLANFAHPTLPGVFESNFEPAVNGSLWTIKIEVLFYCFVPLMILCCRKFGYRRVMLVVVVASIVWHVGFELVSTATGSDSFARLAKQLPGQLSYFSGGAFAYYRSREGLSAPTWWMAAIAALFYFTCDGLLYWVIAPVAVAFIVYWLAVGLPKIGNPSKYGDFSYGIYLYHFPIAQSVIALGYFEIYPVAATIAVLLATFAVAIASWFMVERRFVMKPTSKGRSRPNFD